MITGEDLRERRRARGWTQAVLGEMVGVKASAVGQWETGATKPSWQMEQKLAEIFDGVKPEESTRVDRLEADLGDMRKQLTAMQRTIKRLGKEFPS